MRKEIVQTAKNELQPLLRALLDVAKGHKIKTRDGNTYLKSPDIRAIGYLLDQALGKARPVIDVATEEGTMIFIKASTSNKQEPKPQDQIND